jgi:hypothetical protein
MTTAHNNQLMAQADHKTKASIKSLPIDVLIMVIEILKIKDALRLCHALHVSEQVAAQYCYYEEDDILDILDIKLKPNSYKFLFKNKRFQIEAGSLDKTWIALRTFDLDFLKKCIEEFKLDLNEALFEAAEIGFTDAVKLLLSDSRVDPSVRNNEALRNAAFNGRTEIVKLLLSDSRVDISEEEFNDLICEAEKDGHLELVELLESNYSDFIIARLLESLN